MANKPRQSLISDNVLPVDTMERLLGNRRPVPEPSPITEQEPIDKLSTSQQANKTTIHPASNIVDNTTNQQYNQPAIQLDKKTTILQDNNAHDAHDISNADNMLASSGADPIKTEPIKDDADQARAARIQELLDLLQDDGLILVSARIPSRVNNYIEDYVGRMNRLNRRLKLRKQDIFIRALVVFCVDHPLPETSTEL